MGSFVEIKRGVRVVRSRLSTDCGFPVYQNSMTPLGYYEKSNCSANTAFVIAAGAAGEIGYSADAFWAADDCFYFDCPEGLLSRYLYHALLCQKDELSRHARKASIPRLSRQAIERLCIPLPSIDEQKRIISILDRFDALCNDISSGLPAEIEARTKQYEYYRDNLLSFKGVDEDENKRL